MQNRFMNIHPELFDTVALLKDIPEQKLVKGQVGAIVMAFEDGYNEDEFVEKSGYTIAVITLHESEFLVLHYEAEIA